MHWIRKIPPAVFATLLLLVLWNWAAARPTFTGSLPSAWDTIAELLRLLGDSATWASTWVTIQEAVLGLLIGVAIALPAGILLGLSKFAFLSTRFTLNFLRVIPPIVVVPIATLVLGPTVAMAVFVVAWPVAFIVSVQTSYGVRDSDPVLVETLKCYRLSTLQQIRYARLPSAAPMIAYGLKIAIVVSLLASVTAGIIGGAPGLGLDLMYSQLTGLPATTFALVLLLGILGTILSRAVEWLQPKIVFWVPS